WVDLPWNLHLRGNYTRTGSEQKSGDAIGRPIGGNTTPARHMLNANLSWAASGTIKVSLIGEGRYDRYRDFNTVTQQERYYSDYTIFHLGASWRASDAFTLNARINNLTDRDFISQTCELTELQDAYA